MAHGNGFNPRAKVGFTCSTFDLLHAGHVRMLEFCKQHCDRLVVGLQTDVVDRPDKNRPVQTVYERWVQVKGVRWVDDVIPYSSESDLDNLVRTLPHDVRFVGEDWKGRSVTGSHLYSPMGPMKIIYVPRGHTWSTTELRQRVKAAEAINTANEENIKSNEGRNGKLSPVASGGAEGGGSQGG